MPIVKNRAYFSVASLVFYDITIRGGGGGVVKPSHEKSVLDKSWQWFSRQKEIESKNYEYTIHACYLFVVENTALLPYFIKKSLCNTE